MSASRLAARLAAALARLERKHWTALVLVGFAIIFATSLARVAKKVRKGQTAFLRWKPEVQALLRGEDVYTSDGEGPEGHPNLPMMSLLLAPFYALSDKAGALLFTALKCGCAVLIILAPLRALRAHGPPGASAAGESGARESGARESGARERGQVWPLWGGALLLGLSARVITSDLTHANVNLLVGGVLAGALLLALARREVGAGALVGLAAVLKATPALFVLWFAWQRRWRAVGGAVLGVVLALVVIPSAVLGPRRNLELVRGWTEQMLAPLAAQQGTNATPVGYMNQSLYGVTHRLLTDVAAIPPKDGLPERRVALAHLERRSASAVVGIAALAVLAALALATRRRAVEVEREGEGEGEPEGERGGDPARRAGGAASRVGPLPTRAALLELGGFAAVFLATVLLSPRSWKHHYVLLALAHAFLLHAILRRWAAGRGARGFVAALGASLVCHVLSGEGLLGEPLSDLTEAYGIFVWGAVVLLAAILLELRALAVEDGPSRAPGLRARPPGAPP